MGLDSFVSGCMDGGVDSGRCRYRAILAGIFLLLL